MTIVQTHDAEDTFFYLDQPYVDANQGRYDGYMQEDFDSQLRLLETLKGQFLLSSYRNKASRDFSDRNGWWRTLELGVASPMTHGGKTPRKKVEASTANYPISVKSGERVKKELVNKD
jgi:DNA adenine methylase